MRFIPNSLRRLSLAGFAVVVLGGAAVGVAAAQTQPTATPQGQTAYQNFVDALAKRLNISTQTLQTAITQARQDAGLPANGQGFPGGKFGGRGERGGVSLNAAAAAIGITPQQLHQELPGKSLAQVAQAHGKTANDVATALKNAAHTRIDSQASSRGLTADQVNAQKTQADQRIDQLVNQVMPQGGPGGRGFGGGRGMIGAGLDTAATAIGITQQQLRQELPSKSLAQVAQAHGKTANDVATALKNAAHTRIDSQASSRGLTADQVNAQKTQVDQRIDQFVNQVMPQRPAGAPGAVDNDTGADTETGA